MRIYKYPIPVSGEFILDLPKGSKPLCVQIQQGQPQMWAAIDPMAPLVKHLFQLCGTGHDREDINPFTYLGTFQVQGGTLVFHVFDGGEL